MKILIIGRPDSGKSERAEDLVMKLAGQAPKLYIATMIPFGHEGEERVKKHRRMREGKGFFTLECPVDLGAVAGELKKHRGATCLLECMSNLVGNEIHRPDLAQSDEAILAKILREVLLISGACENLVIVSNEFAHKGEGYDADTIRYCTLLSKVNDALAPHMDEVHALKEGRWNISEHN